MSQEEALWFLGALFGMWVAGYLSGLLFKFVKQVMEQL